MGQRTLRHTACPQSNSLQLHSLRSLTEGLSNSLQTCSAEKYITSQGVLKPYAPVITALNHHVT